MSDMGLIRTNNEDNFQISRDLSIEPMRWINNEACLLTPTGALLVVADGMGGANAGEVASQIAIDTIKELFAPEATALVDIRNPQAVNDYLRAVVVQADARIKAIAATNPATRGMGTTLVIGWLIDGKLYLAWCGDSRAYVFNQATGLHRLSKDHSYVQSLVDNGEITDDQAFDHPRGNVITRCLCDSPVVAEADVLPQPYEVADGDIILLCTDGLCGMLRDYEIAVILATAPADDLTATAKILIDEALHAGGSDNVTVALLQVVSGGRGSYAAPSQGVAPSQVPAGAAPITAPGAPFPPKKSKNLIPILTALGCFVLAAGVGILLFLNGTFTSRKNPKEKIDLINRPDGVNRTTVQANENAVTEVFPNSAEDITDAQEPTTTYPGSDPNSGVFQQINDAVSNSQPTSSPQASQTQAGTSTAVEEIADNDDKTEHKPVIDQNKPILVNVKNKKIKSYAPEGLTAKEISDFVKAVCEMNKFHTENGEFVTEVPDGITKMNIPTVNISTTKPSQGKPTTKPNPNKK